MFLSLAVQRSDIQHLLSECLSVCLIVCHMPKWFKVSKYVLHHMIEDVFSFSDAK